MPGLQDWLDPDGSQVLGLAQLGGRWQQGLLGWGHPQAMMMM